MIRCSLQNADCLYRFVLGDETSKEQTILSGTIYSFCVSSLQVFLHSASLTLCSLGFEFIDLPPMNDIERKINFRLAEVATNFGRLSNRFCHRVIFEKGFQLVSLCCCFSLSCDKRVH